MMDTKSEMMDEMSARLEEIHDTLMEMKTRLDTAEEELRMTKEICTVDGKVKQVGEHWRQDKCTRCECQVRCCCCLLLIVLCTDNYIKI
jgi:hypothetical protein